MRGKLLALLLTVAVLGQLKNLVSTEVYTSIAAVKKMVRNERNLLIELKNKLPSEFTQGEEFLSLYQRKRQVIEKRNLTETQQRLDHPNEVYHVIKSFAKSYDILKQNITDDRQLSGKFKHLMSVAGSQDLDGSLLALLRLQDVYSFKTAAMIAGEYSQGILNFSGPGLTSEDMFLLGDIAFRRHRYSQSVDWLQAAINHYSPPLLMKRPLEVTYNVSRAHIFALLARSLLRNGDKSRAKHIYKTWEPQDEEELKTLGKELDNGLPHTEDSTDHPIWDHFRMCATPDARSKPLPGPAHRCRYRGPIPYYRFKEEVVSQSPYISIIYDVISDRESSKLKRLSLSQMSRGEVVTNSGVQFSYTRTCHVAFLADHTSPTLLALSRRVGYITGLDTTVSPQGFLSPTQSSSEPLQLVNYGIGGYFGMHRDPFEYRNPITNRTLTYSGNRIASFLIYLSSVHLGGYTSFPYLQLLLRPEKNSALFWYNFSPSGHQEVDTYHQGCPVVVGDKWIANKWILSYGNTFVRRCGLRQEDTQADIEEDMLRGYR